MRLAIIIILCLHGVCVDTGRAEARSVDRWERLRDGVRYTLSVREIPVASRPEFGSSYECLLHARHEPDGLPVLRWVGSGQGEPGKGPFRVRWPGEVFETTTRTADGETLHVFVFASTDQNGWLWLFSTVTRSRPTVHGDATDRFSTDVCMEPTQVFGTNLHRRSMLLAPGPEGTLARLTFETESSPPRGGVTRNERHLALRGNRLTWSTPSGDDTARPQPTGPRP
jgi:hypothetical protein